MKLEKQKLIRIIRIIFTSIILILSVAIAINFHEVFVIAIAITLVSGSNLYMEIEALKSE